MSIFILIFLTILFLIINNQISKSDLQFLKTLNIEDGIVYFLYMLFCFICFLFLFQEIKLPIIYEYSIWFKILLGITSFKLTSLIFCIQNIKNPNNVNRLDMLQNIEEQNAIIDKMKENERKVGEIRTKQKKILKNFKSELLELENSDCSEEELQEKIKLLTNKYDKLFEDVKNNVN